MGRDHQKLTVFQKADALVVLVYRLSRNFPADERFGLRSQLRRATVSIAPNIVEGSARDGRRDYVRFLDIALGSAAETAYLLRLAQRLEFIDEVAGDECRNGAIEVRKMLEKLIIAVRRLDDRR